MSKISLAQHFWILRSLIKLSFVVFPHTEQHYFNIDVIKALYNNFLNRRGRYFFALLSTLDLEINLVIVWLNMISPVKMPVWNHAKKLFVDSFFNFDTWQKKIQLRVRTMRNLLFLGTLIYLETLFTWNFNFEKLV